MILVNKKCTTCDKIDELTYIPKDMVNESFECPYCNKGKITYSDITDIQ